MIKIKINLKKLKREGETLAAALITV